MTHRPQKRLQLWSQRGFCCLVDCSMSHYSVNIYVGKLTFYCWVKTCAVICAWQRCGSGVKLLEDLYVSVSNNSVFAQQVIFFCAVMLRLSLRALCTIIVESFDLYIRPWVCLTTQHQSSLENFPSFDSLLRTPKLPSRKQRICIPHLSLSSWQSNAAPQPKISERWEKTPVDSLPFTEKSNQTNRSNYTQTTHADGNCEVQMRLKGHRFPKGTDLCWNGWKCLQSITYERETHKKWFLSDSQQCTRGNYLIWNHFKRNIKSKALNVCVFTGMFGWFIQ